MFALNRARMPVRCRKLCTNVSMAIMLPPTSIQRAILFGSAEQDARQGHGEDLVRDAVDLAQRLNQGCRHSS